MRRTCLLLTALLACTGLPASEIALHIGAKPPLVIRAADLELMPRQTVTAADHGGEEAEWSGVPLHLLLKRAGADFGEALRGPSLAQYVLVTAGDGYRAVLALPELDPRCTDDPVLLCDQMNGAPLPEGKGPLRLILPKERRHFRWVWNVVKIELRQVN